MSIFQNALDRIESNRMKKDTCIPIEESFPRLSNYVPGIQKKRYYIVSGASGRW